MAMERLSPLVQLLQAASPYIDVYTNASTSLIRTRPLLQPLSLALPHAHPEPSRWKNAGGWGARHVNDHAPFNLWNDDKRTFRLPKGADLEWMQNKFGHGLLGLGPWYMYIETEHPPQPVPLTVGCVPVMFVGVGEAQNIPSHIPSSPYSNPRIPDPCPNRHWRPMTFPSKETNIAILTALQALANVKAVTYLPCWMVVELEVDDGRTYTPNSLPGKVGGCTALYHHSETPFYHTLKDLTRERRVDPANHPRDKIGPLMPQDGENYLRNSTHLSPGCRLECGFSGPDSDVNAATSAGVKLRHVDGREAITVANHGFLISQDVYHPFADADKIGEVVDNIPELDIGLVQLTPIAANKFSNRSYFQAETPTALLRGEDIKAGSWSEVDGMSSGLVSLLAYGQRYFKPPRPAGYPEIDFREWRDGSLSTIFGAVNNSICDGMCGAPVVQCETGGVGGFFHLSDGLTCFTAHLDNLVAEGWEIAL